MVGTLSSLKIRADTHSLIGYGLAGGTGTTLGIADTAAQTSRIIVRRFTQQDTIMQARLVLQGTLRFGRGAGRQVRGTGQKVGALGGTNATGNTLNLKGLFVGLAIVGWVAVVAEFGRGAVGGEGRNRELAGQLEGAFFRGDKSQGQERKGRKETHGDGMGLVWYQESKRNSVVWMDLSNNNDDDRAVDLLFRLCRRPCSDDVLLVTHKSISISNVLEAFRQRLASFFSYSNGPAHRVWRFVCEVHAGLVASSV